MHVDLLVLESDGDSNGAPLAGMRALKLPGGGALSDEEPEDMQVRNSWYGANSTLDDAL